MPDLPVSSGGSRGGARGARPLFLDQTEARRDEKSFFKTAPPYLRVWMTGSPPPPPPLSQGLDPALISTIKLVEKYKTANWSLRQGDGEANKRIKQNYIFKQIPQSSNSPNTHFTFLSLLAGRVHRKRLHWFVWLALYETTSWSMVKRALFTCC